MSLSCKQNETYIFGRKYKSRILQYINTVGIKILLCINIEALYKIQKYTHYCTPRCIRVTIAHTQWNTQSIQHCDETLACSHIYSPHTHTHAHTHIQPTQLTNIHSTCEHTHTLTHTHTHTHTHAHTHTHTHTHTQLLKGTLVSLLLM